MICHITGLVLDFLVLGSPDCLYIVLDGMSACDDPRVSSLFGLLIYPSAVFLQVFISIQYSVNQLINTLSLVKYSWWYISILLWPLEPSHNTPAVKSMKQVLQPVTTTPRLNKVMDTLWMWFVPGFSGHYSSSWLYLECIQHYPSRLVPWKAQWV